MNYRAFRFQLVATIVVVATGFLTNCDSAPQPPIMSLHDAVVKGNKQQVAAVIYWCRRNGDCDVNRRDSKGRTALHLAVSSGWRDVVETLIAEGVDVDECDGGGEPPLLHAAEALDSDIVDLLIKAGADTNMPCDNAGFSVLDTFLLSVQLDAALDEKDLDWSSPPPRLRDVVEAMIEADASSVVYRNEVDSILNATPLAESKPRKRAAIPQVATPTFHGHPCTDDCSGHESGYAWAEQKGIDDPENCTGKSQSFIEGCRIYVEEH